MLPPPNRPNTRRTRSPYALNSPVFEHDLPHLVRLDPRVAVPFPAIRREEQLPQARKHLPVGAESVDVAVRDATMQVRRPGRGRSSGSLESDVPRNIEVVVVGLAGDLGPTAPCANNREPLSAP